MLEINIAIKRIISLTIIIKYAIKDLSKYIFTYFG